jgi:hypothetical protein
MASRRRRFKVNGDEQLANRQEFNMPGTLIPEVGPASENGASVREPASAHPPTDQEKFDAEVSRKGGVFLQVLAAVGIVTAIGMATLALVVASQNQTGAMVKVGKPTQMRIDNKDSSPHSITAPGTGVSIIVNPGVHTYTMIATKAGRYEWMCVIPCDSDAHGWAMTHPGYMAGYITVT